MRSEDWTESGCASMGCGETHGLATSKFDATHRPLLRTWSLTKNVTGIATFQTLTYGTSRSSYACGNSQLLRFESDDDNDGVIDGEISWEHDVAAQAIVERRHGSQQTDAKNVIVRQYRCGP